MNLTAPIQITGAQAQAFGDTPLYALGTRGIDRSGRKFRYVRAGASTLVAGNALQAPAPVANHQACAVAAAAAAGATSFTATLGATLATANQYAGGYAIMYVTPGNGYAYAIDSHAAVASAGVITLNLPKDEPIAVALTTSSKVSLTPNPYDGVIQTPVTTLTGAVVGGAYAAITAVYYGWIQTGGVFAGLIDGTPAVGQGLSCPGAVAGGFAINSSTLPIVAYAMVVGVDTKNQQILLVLD